VDLATAAARLGISVEALRKRIARHQVAAVKADGRWFVLLDSRPDHVQDNGHVRPDTRPDLDGPQSTTGQPRPDAVQDSPDATRELVDVLKAQVADLQGRLDASQQAEAELRRLLAIALQQHALPAPNSAPAMNDVGPANPSAHLNSSPAANTAPWWRRWAWWRG
jgi:hypothetical protein